MKINPIFKTTLAKDMPAGPQGQPVHEKGTEFSFASAIDTEKLGKFIMVTPNPVFFYFNFTEQLIEEFKNELISIDSSQKEWHMFGSADTTPTDKFRNLDNDLLYSCIQKAMAIPIFLFTAMEAFANQMIPENYIYKAKRADKVLEFDKKQIERCVGTEEKIGIILSDIYSKELKQSPLWAIFKDLKDLRDSLVHLKTGGVHYIRAYEGIYGKMIDTDYEIFFENIKGIMIFFVPKYFE